MSTRHPDTTEAHPWFGNAAVVVFARVPGHDADDATGRLRHSLRRVFGPDQTIPLVQVNPTDPGGHAAIDAVIPVAALVDNHLVTVAVSPHVFTRWLRADRTPAAPYVTPPHVPRAEPADAPEHSHDVAVAVLARCGGTTADDACDRLVTAVQARLHRERTLPLLDSHGAVFDGAVVEVATTRPLHWAFNGDLAVVPAARAYGHNDDD